MTKFHYLRALDGIRGFAVLSVMLCHQTLVQGDSSFEKATYGFLRLGWVGVDIFFVLSGFLITTILLEQRGEPHYFRNFFARRALRIVPLYYAILFLYFFLVPLLPDSLSRNLEPFHYSQAWFWGFLSNILIATEGRWIQPPLSASWSLAIEEQFYLFWPFLILRLAFRNLMALCGVLILSAGIIRFVMSASGANPIAIYVLPFTRVDTLAWGAVIAAIRYFHPEWLKHSGQVLSRRFYCLFALGLGICGYFGRDSHEMAVAGYAAIALGAAALLTGTLLGEPVLRRFFENRFLIEIGKRSYAIYLLHVPVVGLLATLFMPSQFSDGKSRALAQGLLTLGASFSTILLSYLVYYGWERHFLKLKRFFPTSGGVATHNADAKPLSVPS